LNSISITNKHPPDHSPKRKKEPAMEYLAVCLFDLKNRTSIPYFEIYSLFGSGSEVAIYLEAQKALSKQGVSVRVVSMPSWELFERTSQKYKDAVLPPKVTARVAVEAGISMGWERYVGSQGATVCIDRFGASAPGSTVMDKYGMKAATIVAKTKELVER
jgi:transketolase